MKNDIDIIANHYCISFIDLLGQRAEYKGEGLLPQAESEMIIFKEKIRRTITPIYDLQKSATTIIEAALNHKGTFREHLSGPDQQIYNDMREIVVNQQRWSDGLVYFVSLRKDSTKSPSGGIFHLLGAVGCLCLLGLCRARPLRGSVEVAWGVELHPGEIYGAAVANAYEFESKIAQYPRIVVGERVLKYLEATVAQATTDKLSEFNRRLAEICLSFFRIDFDGYYILDYLGDGFRENITKAKHDQLSKAAFQFVVEQLNHWNKLNDEKLAVRYGHLYDYFRSHLDT